LALTRHTRHTRHRILSQSILLSIMVRKSIKVYIKGMTGCMTGMTG